MGASPTPSEVRRRRQTVPPPSRPVLSVEPKTLATFLKSGPPSFKLPLKIKKKRKKF
ncbi:hypothetical protein HanIR_Chr06g0268461 [Helianthus annuus]|nr:hypothetical protein HanIR_Chr06g0268461 [Helianthus annuus]